MTTAGMESSLSLQAGSHGNDHHRHGDLSVTAYTKMANYGIIPLHLTNYRIIPLFLVMGYDSEVGGMNL